MTGWRRRERAGELVDLTADSAFTMELLDDTWRWRQRAVESLTLDSSEHLRATTSYQIEFPELLVRPYLGDREPRRARVLVPITTRAKRPLLNFGVTGPGGRPAHLLLRPSIAALEAEYLGRLVESSPARETASEGLPAALLEAVCVFTPAVAREFQALHDDPLAGLAAYLSDGLGFPVSRDAVARWDRVQRQAGAVLAGALQEGEDAFSSAERVLLAVPRMEPRPASAPEIEQIVGRYLDAVQALADADDRPLLVALADYGRRWEVIVETEVPLGTASTIHLTEDRPLGLDGGGWCRQRIAMGDARSFHLFARVTDHTVRLSDFDVRDLRGVVLGIPRLEAARHTPESFSLYSAEPDRPYYADVRLRLRPVVEMLLPAWLVAGLALVAVIGTILVPGGEDLVAALGVLVVPTTFAVALVLVRAESSLSARLQRRVKLGLCAAIAVLWATALLRLLVWPGAA